ncbi:multiple inositol polyphosphate phosphatase 1-like [Adelges cooleyi]|uniref:multiple inositol polyphosphate phosphatase 1-like n=1 Tax=Adelges cooleyi TaxID=133065 RepID=UPI0021806000|nr:multiple inositol polyphosphate phosphatase 1-like [Adelges cooleyi]XP_050431342.1 multiple inositol polyphosphate phosphatase 1-like [Adelges cooleyi]
MYMNKMYQLFGAIIYFFGQHVTSVPESEKEYWFFDSKTAYDIVHGYDLKVPENCQIQQIFGVFRHGTRYGSKDDTKDMKKLLPFRKDLEKNANMPKEDIEAIQNWTIGVSDDINKDLNEQGIQDMKKLSLRVKNAFGDIFQETFNTEIHKVLTSHETRARQSGYHFLKNAFGKKINITSIDDLPMFEKTDVTLNIDKLREKKLTKEEKAKQKALGTGPITEMTKFQNSPIMLRTLENIAYKLGLKSPLRFEHGKAMYESCRLERAVNTGITPPWCTVFCTLDLQVFEYLNDIGWYYKLGWGNPDGYRLGCPLLTRLNLSFKNAADRKGAKAVLYFGHRDNLFVVITILGLAKDDTALKADNMDEMAKRKWRTSFINPFAANMIAAFYSCNDNVDRVSFFLNEKLVPIELKDKKLCTLCDWKDVKEKFDKITDDEKCTFGHVITAP